MWKLTLEIVQVLSQIGTVTIAGFGVWVAYQTLLRTPHQTSVKEPGAEVETESGVAPGTGIDELVVFDTSKQTTTLRVKDGGIACFLLDKASGAEKRQWGFTQAAIKRILEEHDYRAHAGYKPRNGLFSIGPRRNWLYSKSLFLTEEDLEHELRRLLQTAIT